MAASECHPDPSRSLLKRRLPVPSPVCREPANPNSGSASGALTTTPHPCGKRPDEGDYLSVMATNAVAFEELAQKF